MCRVPQDVKRDYFLWAINYYQCVQLINSAAVIVFIYGLFMEQVFCAIYLFYKIEVIVQAMDLFYRIEGNGKCKLLFYDISTNNDFFNG